MSSDTSATYRGGALPADVNGDGWLDLYICKGGSGELYMNDGTGAFTEMGALAGFGSADGCGAWGDFDNDGVPELYLTRINQANLLYRKLNAASDPMAGRTLFVRPVSALWFTHSARTFGAIVVLYKAGTTTRVYGGGVRTIAVKPPVEGLYVVCHAFQNLLEPTDESDERFTLQRGLLLTVRFAISDLTPQVCLLPSH